MDDVWLGSQLPGMIADGDIWAASLHDRRHWKSLSTLDVADSSSDAVRWARTETIVRDKFGTHVVISDDARAKTFQRTDPGPYITSSQEQDERPKILVVARDGKSSDLVERRSSMVEQLGERRIRVMRVFASPERFDEVLSEWQTEFAKNG